MDKEYSETRIFSATMAGNGNVHKLGKGTTAQDIIDRRVEVEEEGRLNSQIVSICYRLSMKEHDFAVANLHYAHVLRRQYTNGSRWFEICRLRSLEIHQHKIGLVLKFEVWMRKLDQNLALHGVFVGSPTKKYLIHPELGEFPQMEYDDVDIDLT